MARIEGVARFVEANLPQMIELDRVEYFDVSICAFAEQHAHDLLGRAIAKQLPFVLFVPGDTVVFDLFDEVLRRIPRESRAAKTGIFRNEIFGLRITIGEVATTAAGDTNFFAQDRSVIDDCDALAALCDLRRTKQARGAGAQDDNIVEGFLNQ